MTSFLTQSNIAYLVIQTGRSYETVRAVLSKVQNAVTTISSNFEVKENGVCKSFKVTRKGVGQITTHAGLFYQYDFEIDDNWRKYSVLFKGKVDENWYPILKNPDKILIRIDSGCETGQVFNDKTCDCKEQLHLAMSAIEARGEGFIINIPYQDGRGQGLIFKLATLVLQDELDLDTVESARLVAQSHEIDIRTYSGVIAILKHFGLKNGLEIDLATNNPKKTGVFAENNYRLSSMKSVVVPPTEYTEKHLKAKQDQLGHINLV
jgi:3,4-dihydroxy 2-butanone 4-phosphate synthase / GTP cyclohydrolase II